MEREELKQIVENNFKEFDTFREIDLSLFVKEVMEAIDEYAETVKHDVIKAKALLKELTDDERMEIFGDYCKYCGSINPSCQCWNDE